MGFIQLGPISTGSTSILSGLGMLGSEGYSTLIPWRFDSEDESRHANWSTHMFSSRRIRVTDNLFSLLVTS